MPPKVGSAIRFRRTVRRKSVAPAGGFGSCASGIPPVDTGGTRSGTPFGGSECQRAKCLKFLGVFSPQITGQSHTKLWAWTPIIPTRSSGRTATAHCVRYLYFTRTPIHTRSTVTAARSRVTAPGVHVAGELFLSWAFLHTASVTRTAEPVSWSAIMQDLWNPLFLVAAIVSLSFMLRYSKNVEQEKAISLLNENNRLLRELIAELREARQDSGVVIDRDRISN
jgi:hypothetical protein